MNLTNEEIKQIFLENGFSIKDGNHDLKEYVYKSAHSLIKAFIKKSNVEPFGYFRCDAFGWMDCAEDDEGAVALYEHPTDNFPDASKMMQGEVVVTTNSKGECVLVSRQDEEGRILNVIWDKEKGLKLASKNNNLPDQDDIDVVDLNRPSAIELQHAEIGIAEPVTDLLNPVA